MSFEREGEGEATRYSKESKGEGASRRTQTKEKEQAERKRRASGEQAESKRGEKEKANWKEAKAKNRMRCIEAGCGRGAAWGEAGGAAFRCWEHKRGGELVNPRRQCGEAGCGQAGMRGAEGRGARWCEAHAAADAETLRAEACEGCGAAGVLRRGRCASCRPEGERGAQEKERAIRKLLLAAAAIPVLRRKDRRLSWGVMGWGQI